MYLRARKELLLPLLDLFSTVDDVFTEDNAFEDTFRKLGYGRIYRAWLDTREVLDPDFDKNTYRNNMKLRMQCQERQGTESARDQEGRPQKWLQQQVRREKRDRRRAEG
jgi:hypothetical protein